MYYYHDYFEYKKRFQPYTIPGEELEDYLRLLDMLLENYLEYKGMGSQKKLFSRGLVITESELESYFEMPPYFRERDLCNPSLAEASRAAFGYIEERTAHTKEIFQGSENNTAQNISKLKETEILRIDNIRNTFNLDNTELMAVLMALAVEIDRRYERIFGFLQDNITLGAPTTGLLFALMARITPRDGAEEVIPHPLNDKMYTYFFLRKEEQEGLNSTLVLQPLAKKILMGIRDEGEAVNSAYHPYLEDKDIPLFFEQSAQEISYILSTEGKTKKSGSGENRRGRMVYLCNPDEETSLHLLSRLCCERNESLYILDMLQILEMSPEKRRISLSELYLRLKLSDCRLAIRYLSEDEDNPARETDQRTAIQNILEEICRVCEPKNVFLYGQKDEPGELAAMLIPYLKIPEASVALRTEIWEYFLKSEKGIRISSNIVIPDLADYYEISYGMIRKAVGHAVATSRTKRSTVIDRKMVLESLHQLNQVDFSGLATYVNPVYTWKDITITDSQKAVLKTACDRCRLRNRIGEGWGLKTKNAYGNGVSLLLYGPPGTGKTMAAQVVANELELPLYRVDISQISSKYIGETEKNLGAIFKAAAKANVILFFDEADALFSKRTEVSDSHDKYANNETAFLLQKIEEYNGMSILATNYYNNFDDAFVRRITYAVHMESPDKNTRYALWTTILPKTAKMSKNIDFRFLADKFELSGSNIKAILFNAAYMAGADNEPIGAKHIVKAMQYEFNKLGKLVNHSDFGEYKKYLEP